MAPSLFDLAGRVSMVSGAASGMGQAMSLAVAEAGSDIVLVDIDEEGAKATAHQVKQLGRNAIVVDCDVSDATQISSLFERLDREFGRLDFLGNVAGQGILASPTELTLTQLDRVLQQLVVGRFFMCQQAGTRMLRQGRGSIVNIGSLASSTALGRSHIAYSMAMGAVVQMTRELSTEWAAAGVRVNAILPAQVTNPGLRKRMALDPHLQDRFLSGIPAGRMGNPEDIKGLSVLLASDASSWITGALIPMDGGNMAMNAGGTPGSLHRQ